MPSLKELQAMVESAAKAESEANEKAAREKAERETKHRQALELEFATFEKEIVVFLKEKFPNLSKNHPTIVAEKTKVAAMIVAGIRKGF